MNERTYLFIVGALILFALYFTRDRIIVGLCLWLLFEGITNIRLTTLLQKIRHKQIASGLTVFNTHQRFSFDSLRAWRLSVVLFLGGSFFLLQTHNIEMLWFLPWFMGFAIIGAGVSGICPMLLLLRWLGFR